MKREGKTSKIGSVWVLALFVLAVFSLGVFLSLRSTGYIYAQPEQESTPAEEITSKAPPELSEITSPTQTIPDLEAGFEYIPIPLNPVKMTDSSIERGRRLYIQNCIGCHGRLADGKGPRYFSLDPRPRNLTIKQWIEARPDGWLFISIKNGIPGTAMPAWGSTFSATDIWNIINWIKYNAGVERDSPIARPLEEIVKEGEN